MEPSQSDVTQSSQRLPGWKRRSNSGLPLGGQATHSAFHMTGQELPVFLGILVCKMRLRTGMRPSPDESCLGAVQATCLPACLSRWLQDQICNHKQPHSDFRRGSTPRGRDAAGKNRAITTLIIYFSPSTPKPARKRRLIPSAFPSCNIYSKPEPLPVNVLSEELYLL